MLREDEKVLWVGEVNKSAFVKYRLRISFLFGLIPHLGIVTLGLTFPYNLVLLILSVTSVIPIWIGLIHFTLSVIAWIIYASHIKKLANNTYFCITDKQIIKRSGAYANDYQRFPLTNIGTIEIDANIYDSKHSPESATLKVIVKNFTAGDSKGILTINNLSDAHVAYKILSKYSDNEAVRIKQVQ